MKKKIERTEAFKRRRKFLLVLPLLTLPFVTLAFWAMGGGKEDTNVAVVKEEGLKTELPESANSNAAEDKMSFYARADRDSLSLAEMKRNDPYYKNGFDSPQANGLIEERTSDPNEARVMERLNALQKAVSEPTRNSQINPYQRKEDDYSDAQRFAPAKHEEDQEVKQLNEMLDKIRDIQHPEAAREKLKAASLQQKAQVYKVNVERDVSVELLGARDTVRRSGSGFYGEVDLGSSSARTIAIPAVVEEGKSLTNGSTVKLRLLADVYVRGVLIPKNAFAFGVASLNNDRLEISIENLSFRDDLFPVALSVYDQDGIKGVHVPGSINREVSKNSADQTVQSLGVVSLDPSLQAQVAAAGLNAAKGLLSRKVKQVKVYVKSGYRVLLKDNNQQNF